MKGSDLMNEFISTVFLISCNIYNIKLIILQLQHHFHLWLSNRNYSVVKVVVVLQYNIIKVNNLYK